MKKIKEFFSNLFKKKDTSGQNGSSSTTIKNDTTVITQKKISKYNWILFGIATFLALVFIIGIIPSPKSKKIEDKITPVNVAPVKNIEAKINFSKDKVDALSQKVNSSFDDKIIITALEGEIKINSVKLDPLHPSVIIKDDCDQLDKLVPALNSCTIDISWFPIVSEEKTLNIVISWEDLSSLTPKTNSSIILLNLKTAKEEPKIIREPVVEPVPVFVPKEEPKQEPLKVTKPLFDDIKPIKTPTINAAKPVTGLKEIVPVIDCKKYAITAYGLNGNPIGWIRPDKTVYSHRCTKVLGKLGKDGKIFDDNGNLIGYDNDGFSQAKLKNMLDIVIPDNWFDYDNKKAQDSEIWAGKIKARREARIAAKGQGGGTKVNGIDARRVANSKEVYESYVNSKVPYTVTAGHQMSSPPKDETYVIRRYKPIPAVIAYPVFTSKGYPQMPAIGIVERNVYGENGRTVIIPAGSKLLGQATGQWPATYVSYSKVQIHWLRIIRPDGAEFTFEEGQAISADAQGKLGVPGKGATDYLEQFVKPMITALVPAAINLLDPVSQAYTSKIILDTNGSTTQQIQGTEKSTENAKKELIRTWNTIASKFVEDSMANNTPPFEVPAGTRITVYPTKDIMLRFSDEISIPFAPAGAALAGVIEAPKEIEDPSRKAYETELAKSNQAFQDIQQAGFEAQISKPKDTPAPVKEDPFKITQAGAQAPVAAPAAAEPEFIGSTPEGYEILGDDIGCWTENPKTGDIVDDPYIDETLDCF